MYSSSGNRGPREPSNSFNRPRYRQRDDRVEGEHLNNWFAYGEASVARHLNVARLQAGPSAGRIVVLVRGARADDTCYPSDGWKCRSSGD